MRAIWVDSGNDADYTRLKAEGIESPVYAITDPRITKAYLADVYSKGFVPGVYAVKSWWPALTPTQFATQLHHELERVAPGTPGDHPFVCVDYEPTDAAGIMAFALQWRKHRPGRVTDLTIEGHQGGLFTVTQMQAVARKFRYLVPQAYNAAMTNCWCPYFMVRDLVEHGAPFAKCRPFYDAKWLDQLQWWSGYAFTQGRLPT